MFAPVCAPEIRRRHFVSRKGPASIEIRGYSLNLLLDFHET